uniref:Uncharacterized protein n=1 Tax=Tetradesmus obliquus TaxID=3088 RepID=A0A383VFQ6_TETOB
MKPLILFFLLAAVIGTASAEFHAANMTLMSGQVVALDELYRASNWSCCVPRSVLGDSTPVVRIDESQGQYYATADPECKVPITADAYPSTYQAVWMCGNCTGDGCVPADGGLFLALPGDWCVDSNNTQDALVLCSTAAPLCDVGYSGKCIELADEAKQPLLLTPSMTLQSGMVVDFSKLQESYTGQCCLPRSVLNDASAVMRMDNSGGSFFVSNDPACASPIPSSVYPASFEYISICAAPTPAAAPDTAATDDLGLIADDFAPTTVVQTEVIVDGGVVLVPAGSADTVVQCNPYASACWGAAPICSFANVCIGINTYDYAWVDNYWDDAYPWGYYRPAWFRPLAPIYRPSWWRQPYIHNHDGHRPWWNPRPDGWNGGHIPGGWRPGHRPDSWAPKPSWKPPSGWKPDQHQHAGPFWRPGSRNPGTPAPNPGAVTGHPTGPGVVLPTSPRSTGSSFLDPGRGGASLDGTSPGTGTGRKWWQGGGPLRSTGSRGLGRPGRGSTPTTPAAGMPGSPTGLGGLGGRGPGITPGSSAPFGPGASTPGTNTPGPRGGSGSTGPRWGSFMPYTPRTPGAATPGRGVGSTPTAPTGRPSWQLTPPRGSTTYTPTPAMGYNPIRGGTPGRSFTPAPAAVAPGRISTPFAPAPARGYTPPGRMTTPGRSFTPAPVMAAPRPTYTPPPALVSPPRTPSWGTFTPAPARSSFAPSTSMFGGYSPRSSYSPSWGSGYTAPRYTPSYSAPRYTPSYSAPRYTPSYSAPRSTPSYSAPRSSWGGGGFSRGFSGGGGRSFGGGGRSFGGGGRRGLRADRV